MEATVQTALQGPRARYLRAYSETGKSGPELLVSLLPPQSDPDYLWVLTELVRLDLAQSRESPHPYRLADYQELFPELFADPILLRQLAREEFVAVQQLSSSVKQTCYADDFAPLSSEVTYIKPANPADTPLPASDKFDSALGTCAVSVKASPQATDCVEVDEDFFLPNSRTRIVKSLPSSTTIRNRFPRVQEEFLGFRLVEELGTGAFARVFLAEQIGLANRLVALKVTTRPTREPQRLAKLRHTNVVPIYSVHEDAHPFQAVCMPFLGKQTLADLLKVYRQTGIFPHTSVNSASTAQLVHESTVKSNPVNQPAPQGNQAEVLPEVSWPMRARLGATTHIDLVLWLLSRMTEGLAHAHDMGILHLDLKPGNVLFADDGEPLLLDFNLSFDRNAHDRERAGGTLPYMAPEQLEDFRDQGDGPARVDERTDLFALGVLTFELLTGRHPFPMSTDRPINLTKLADARWEGPPSLKALNPEISLAVESIVLKLLDPDPARRYQSARQLLEDLHRQRDNQPLRHAPNRSLKERFEKWRNRNPGLTLYFCLTLAILSTAGFWYAAYRREESRLRSEVTLQTRAVHDSLTRLRVDLTTRDDAKIRQAGRMEALAILNYYNVPSERKQFLKNPVYTAMSPAEQSEFRQALSELCLLLAHSEWLDAEQRPTPHRKQELERGLLWNEIAASCYVESDSPPLTVQRQRQILEAARDGRSIPLDLPSGDLELTGLDLFHWAVELMACNRYAQAIPLLEELTLRKANHFAGHFALAICQQQVGNSAVAITNYKVAQALVSHDPRPAFNRGLLLLSRKEYAKAEQEFTESLKRSPSHAISYYHRAISRSRQRKFQEALADANSALEGGVPQIQGLMLRANLHRALNQVEQYQSDLAMAEQLDPVDAMDYLARGTSRIARQPEKALEDLTKATELNSQYFVAWQNLAHLLSEKLHDPVRALEAQNKAVELAPDFASARAGRAVLLARTGRRAEAHEDAEKSLLISEDASTIYQACCAYAITAQKHPEDISRAVTLFRQALRAGYRDFANIEKDADLKAIGSQPEFKAALKAAKELTK
jgi:eukaryotic-like serine/threonine-protein kinase